MAVSEFGNISLKSASTPLMVTISIHSIHSLLTITTQTDFCKIGAQVTGLSFHPQQNYLIGSGTGGVVIVWGELINEPIAPIQFLAS
jgi:hypothetical protein